MDWAKAKNIVIVALLVTNLFLIAVYGTKSLLDVREEENLLEETMELLESRGIAVETEIPEKQGPMAVLSVDYINLEAKRLDRMLREEVSLPQDHRSLEEMLAAAEDFFIRFGIWEKEMLVEECDVMDGRLFLSYGNSIDGIPLEGSRLYCIMEEGRVAAVDGFWLSGRGMGQTTKATIPPVEALLLFAGRLPRGTGEVHINRMEMVYWLDTDAMDVAATVSDTAFPYWKVTYNDNAVMYINAYGE